MEVVSDEILERELGGSVRGRGGGVGRRPNRDTRRYKRINIYVFRYYKMPKRSRSSSLGKRTAHAKKIARLRESQEYRQEEQDRDTQARRCARENEERRQAER